MDLQGQTALVTGANRGIGLDISLALLDAGVSKLYAAVRNPDSAQKLIDSHPGKVVPLAVDLTQPETITAAAEQAGDVTIVVNNAGVLQTAEPLSPDVIDVFQTELEVNVYGLLRVAQAFAPALKANGGGVLVQLNSIASLRNFAAFSTYCASKAAAYSFTQALRDTLAAQNTKVISVHPGPIETDMAKHAGFEESDPPSMVSDAVLNALRNDDYHVFPDTMAQQFWQAYQPFAENVVEPVMGEG